MIGSDRYHQYMQRPGAAEQILADAMNDAPEFPPGTKFKIQQFRLCRFGACPAAHSKAAFG